MKSSEKPDLQTMRSNSRVKNGERRRGEAVLSCLICFLFMPLVSPAIGESNNLLVDHQK